ncbi:hypothetical protein yc1106_06152 [Curvularia clavata]|uniref:Uncharacterized protein n=1 Tax=Curvularia clavata TaxID=95742 RepID=A0A9Q9DSQ1_CURCL|nr:hypothetical protein yc1106_06152 [Curvularia clavata]
MGRSGYDTTYVCNDKNSAAADVVAMVNHQRAQNAEALERAAAAALEAKLIKNKRSRGIKVVNNTAMPLFVTEASQKVAAAEKKAAAALADVQASSKSSGTGTKR